MIINHTTQRLPRSVTLSAFAHWYTAPDRRSISMIVDMPGGQFNFSLPPDVARQLAADLLANADALQRGPVESGVAA
jgi:hypothetical protein